MAEIVEAEGLWAANKVEFTMKPIEGTLDASLRQYTNISALINPSSLKESWTPQWSKRGPLGGSHETLQYIRTTSRQLAFSLWISQHLYIANPEEMMLGIEEERGVLFYRDWFAACTVPFGPRSVPPIVEVNWPQANLHFDGVIESITIDYERFAPEGFPLDFTIELSFTEVLKQGLMTTQEVLRNGMGYAALIKEL